MIKTSLLSSVIILSTLSLGGVFKAQAGTIVPATEGQINTSGSCLTTCVATPGYTVTSSSYPGTSQPSLLFSDLMTTANTYGPVSFPVTDIGTNPNGAGNWFRPVAVNSRGGYIENGHLEVGRFTFTFDKIQSDVKLKFFDVEEAGKTEILSVNGVSTNQFIPAGANNNIQYATLHNVKSFTVQLGAIGGTAINGQSFASTGDGVDLQVSVPEPGMVASLGSLAIVGVLGLRRRKQSSPLI